VSEGSDQRARVLCLGDALVDLVCERHVRDVSEAPAFVPHLGGSGAAVAAVAARAGAPVALAAAAGDDDWGRWLRARLAGAGVDVSAFALEPGAATPVALVTVAESGAPSARVYGEPPVVEIPSPGSALFLTAAGLADSASREAVMATRAAALEAGLPVVFDPGLRGRRWRSQADAAASANACVPGALLVRASAWEAAVMTGEDDVERAALALVKAGARLVVVTLGDEGAILRGELRADAFGVPAQVVSTLGAGDVFTGTLLARLALSDFYPPAVAAGLRDAVAAAARACERWGAVD